MTRTGKSNTTKIVLKTIFELRWHPAALRIGKSYSIGMASMRTRTPRTRENGRRDVAKVAPINRKRVAPYGR